MATGRRSFLKFSLASALGAGLRMFGRGRRAAAQQAGGPGGAVELAEPFAFCVVADPHTSEPPKKGLESCGNAVEKFFACVREMEKLEGEEKPDFMLIVGDVHLWELRKHLDRVPIPMHVIAGNHDAGGAKREMRDLFPADFKQGGREADYYSFVHKGVRFIGLCNAIADHIGHLCSEDIVPRGQCEWLEGELAGPERHKIIFAHIPPEPQGRDLNMFMARNDSRYFNQLLERTQPTAAFFGHQHLATVERKVGRTRSFVLRSCCWNGRRAPIGFMVVRVTPEGISTREIITGRYS